MFMKLHVLMNYEDLDSSEYLPNPINDTLLYLFIKVVTIIFRVSIGGLLFIHVNKEVYEVEENIAKRVNINPWML